MSTRANSLLYLVLRYRGPARVDGDTLARRRQKLGALRLNASVLQAASNGGEAFGPYYLGWVQ